MAQCVQAGGQRSPGDLLQQLGFSLSSVPRHLPHAFLSSFKGSVYKGKVEEAQSKQGTFLRSHSTSVKLVSRGSVDLASLPCL